MIERLRHALVLKIKLCITRAFILKFFSRYKGYTYKIY